MAASWVGTTHEVQLDIARRKRRAQLAGIGSALLGCLFVPIAVLQLRDTSSFRDFPIAFRVIANIVPLLMYGWFAYTNFRVATGLEWIVERTRLGDRVMRHEVVDNLGTTEGRAQLYSWTDLFGLEVTSESVTCEFREWLLKKRVSIPTTSFETDEARRDFIEFVRRSLYLKGLYVGPLPPNPKPFEHKIE